MYGRTAPLDLDAVPDFRLPHLPEQDSAGYLTAVFGDCGQTDYRNSLALSYSTLDYCVQFQETRSNSSTG